MGSKIGVSLTKDRALALSEKPLAIQTRRLQQAGHSDDEPLHIIGKEDLGILCKFIYQTPVLPVMDPVSHYCMHS